MTCLFDNSTAILLCGIAAYSVAEPLKSSAPWVGESLEGVPCAPRFQGFGPYDYTKTLSYQYQHNLFLVESAHFNKKVENLQEGAKRKHHLLTDIDYTLRAWPNHHRALDTVIRYRLRAGKPYQSTEMGPAECYLQRAIHFSPQDATSRMLYGMLLHRQQQPLKALQLYRAAETLAPHDWNTLYNLGLVLVDLERYPEAKVYAERLYTRNFPIQGLKNKLIEQGQWIEKGVN